MEKIKRRILIAEDAPDIRELLEILLGQDYDLETTDNGLKAVLLFTNALCSGKPFDFALMDGALPGKQGLAAVECFRCIEKDSLSDRPPIKVLILTANHRLMDDRMLNRIDAAGLLLKPGALPRIREHLAKLEIWKPGFPRITDLGG